MVEEDSDDEEIPPLFLDEEEEDSDDEDIPTLRKREFLMKKKVILERR